MSSEGVQKDVAGSVGKRIRVLILLRSFDPGGAERQLLQLLKCLNKGRFDVTVGTFYEGAWWAQAQAIDGITLVCLRKRGTYDVAGFMWRAATLARRVRPDIVYGYMTPADVVALAIGVVTRARVIWGVRNSNTDLRPYGLLARLLFGISRRASRFTSAIIANSVSGKRQYADAGFESRAFFVVRNGTDIDEYWRRPNAKSEVMGRLGLGRDVPLVGLVGRVDPQKGHETLLRAIPSVLTRVPTAHFVFAGRGNAELQSELERLACALGVHDRVSWLGHIEEIASLYSALDVCVLPSFWGEGVSNAVAEAMACETPCVVTDVGDSAAVVGDTGVVVEPRDSLALAEGINNVLLGTDRCRGVAARKRIEEHFSVLKMVAQTEQVFEGVLGGTERP